VDDIVEARRNRSKLKADLSSIDAPGKQSKTYFGWVVGSKGSRGFETAPASIGVTREKKIEEGDAKVVTGSKESTASAGEERPKAPSPSPDAENDPQNAKGHDVATPQLGSEMSDTSRISKPVKAGTGTFVEHSYPTSESARSVPPHLRAQLDAALIAAGAKVSKKAGGSGVAIEQTKAQLGNLDGVVASSASEVVATSGEHLPPHRRRRQAITECARATVDNKAVAEDMNLVETTFSAKVSVSDQTKDDAKGDAPGPKDSGAMSHSMYDLGEHDPKNPRFKAQRYYEPILRRYQCPISDCR
jgi:hypothetical protein